MHAEANLSRATLSSDITTAAFKRSHEIQMHSYFKQLFIDILCKSIMIFQNSLMLRNPVSFELADIHTLYTCVKQVQII